MTIVSVGKPLREKLGDDAVDSLVELLNKSQEQQKNGILQFVEEKFERRLTEEISKLEVRLTDRISSLGSKLESKISEQRTELIKWMFIFWVGQLAVMMGLLFTFFKR